MKINNHNISNPSLQPKDPVTESNPAGGSVSTKKILENLDLYIPSPEWLRIQDALNQQPQVRSDRVALAGERLKSGYYLTPDSAQKTAEAMQKSGN